MLSKTLKISALAAIALFCTQTFADSGFKVPVHYNLELVDGASDPSNYSRFNRTLSLDEGKHQIVLTFKDTFKDGSTTRLVQSIDAIVVNIEDLKKDQIISFNYKLPTNIDQAERFAHQQKITLVDSNTGKNLAPAEASYFILTSERGFSLMRDYREELSSLGRLYAPAYVPGSERGITMTAYGAPTIRASPDGIGSNQIQQGLTLEPMSSSTSAMSTSTVGKGPNMATYNELVRMYNSADDATKLKFVKFVMSNK